MIYFSMVSYVFGGGVAPPRRTPAPGLFLWGERVQPPIDTSRPVRPPESPQPRKKSNGMNNMMGKSD